MITLTYVGDNMSCGERICWLKLGTSIIRFITLSNNMVNINHKIKNDIITKKYPLNKSRIKYSQMLDNGWKLFKPTKTEETYYNKLFKWEKPL